MATKTKTPIEQATDVQALQLAEWPARLRDVSGSYLMGVVEAARSILRGFEDEAQRLRESGDYSAGGLNKRLLLFVQGELDRLDGCAIPQLQKARNEVTKLTETLRALPGAHHEAIEVVDVRRFLIELEDIERRQVIHAAIQDGESIIIDAILTAPRFLQRQLLTKVVGLDILELKDSWASGRSPETALRIRQIEECVSLAERSVKLVRHLIVNCEGLEEDARRALSERFGLSASEVAMRAA